MDAATAGLVGALGGAIIAVLGSLATAWASDYRSARRESRARLFNEKLSAYHAFLLTVHQVQDKLIKVELPIRMEHNKEETGLFVKMLLVGSDEIANIVSTNIIEIADAVRIVHDLFDEHVNVARVLPEHLSQENRLSQQELIESIVRRADTTMKVAETWLQLVKEVAEDDQEIDNAQLERELITDAMMEDERFLVQVHKVDSSVGNIFTVMSRDLGVKRLDDSR